MAVANIEEYLKLLPTLRDAPSHLLWSSYDTEADTLYVNFKKPSKATDSDIIDDDVIVRMERLLASRSFTRASGSFPRLNRLSKTS